MFQRKLPVPQGSDPPMRRVRLLIEDPTLATAELSDKGQGGMEVSICSGPSSDREPCPLVMDGCCPLEPVDVVVCGLDGPWARSVHAAWRETPALVVDAQPGIEGSAPERLQHHIGAAMTAIFSPRRDKDLRL